LIESQIIYSIKRLKDRLLDHLLFDPELAHYFFLNQNDWQLVIILHVFLMLQYVHNFSLKRLLFFDTFEDEFRLVTECAARPSQQFDNWQSDH